MMARISLRESRAYESNVTGCYERARSGLGESQAWGVRSSGAPMKCPLYLKTWSRFSVPSGG